MYFVVNPPRKIADIIGIILGENRRVVAILIMMIMMIMSPERPRMHTKYMVANYGYGMHRDG